MKKNKNQSTNLSIKSQASQSAKLIAAQAIELAKRSNKERMRNGDDAWSRFRSLSYAAGIRTPKLSHDDSNIISRNIHDYLEDNWEKILRRCGTKTALCEIAFPGSADSKKLHRITLPPNEDPVKRGTCRNAYNYVKFIEAISTVLDENVGILAYRLLRGTSFQRLVPSQGGRWGEIAKVQIMLQRMADEIDRDFGIYQLYQRTTQLKLLGIENGETDAWPLYGLDVYLPDDANDEYWVSEYRKARTIAMDPLQAYYRRNNVFGCRRDDDTQPNWWIYGFETGALQNDSFFYVPHAPLGYVTIWDLPDRANDAAAYEIAVAREVAALRDPKHGFTQHKPIDGWNEELQCPYGQTERHTGAYALQYHMWLLIYPHPDGDRLIPALYQAGEEGGAYLLPIDMETLDMLHDVIWVSETQKMSLYERIEQLLLDTDEFGVNSLEKSLRKTASWLQHNPILKREKLQHDKKELLEQKYNEIINREI